LLTGDVDIINKRQSKPLFYNVNEQSISISTARIEHVSAKEIDEFGRASLHYANNRKVYQIVAKELDFEDDEIALGTHFVVYSVRGLERSELGGSHGCPGRLWDRIL